MRPPSPAPRRRGRPPKPREEAQKWCWRFLLECGPDFRGTRRRMGSLLADFRAFAAPRTPWDFSALTPSGFRALLRATRRHFLKRPERRAEYDTAKRALTRKRAETRAERERERKR